MIVKTQNLQGWRQNIQAWGRSKEIKGNMFKWSFPSTILNQLFQENFVFHERGLIIDECFMCVAIVCDVLLFIIGSKCRYLCIVCIFDYSQSLIQGKGACCKYRKISSDIDCILMRDPLDGIWLGWTHWRVVGDGNKDFVSKTFSSFRWKNIFLAKNS